MVDPAHLHMTLSRVSFVEDVSQSSLTAVIDRAIATCHGIDPFDISVGPLAGSSGALSFSAEPREQIAALRNRLDPPRIARATGPEKGCFRPHVGIAYSNARVEAASVIKIVAELRDLPTVHHHVQTVSLVRLTRHAQAYPWETVRVVELGRRSVGT